MNLLKDDQKRLIRLLQANARATFASLAKAAGMSDSVCERKVKALVEDGIISRCAALVSPVDLGYDLLALVQVTLKDHSKQTVSAFTKAIGKREEVIACYALSGEMDFLLHVLVPDMPRFREFAMDTLLLLPGVRDTRSSFVMDVIKAEMAWVPGSFTQYVSPPKSDAKKLARCGTQRSA